MWNKRTLYFALLAVLCLSMHSCKSSGFLQQKMRERVTAQTLLEANQRIEQVTAKWHFMPVSTKAGIGGQMSLGGESIWLSARPFLGIESHRLYADSELLQFIDRGQKVYVSDSLHNVEALEQPLKMLIHVLHGCLSNQISLASGEHPQLKDFQYHFDENQHLHLVQHFSKQTTASLLGQDFPNLTSALPLLGHSQQGALAEYIIDEKGDFVQMSLRYDESELLTVNYSDFKNVGDIRFPCCIYFQNTNTRVGESSALTKWPSFRIKLSDIDFEQAPKSSLSIPNHYQALDTKTLLKSLVSFIK